MHNSKLKIILPVIFIILVYWFFVIPRIISKKTRQIDNLVKEVLSEFKVGDSDLIKETHEFKKIRLKEVEIISKTYSVLPGFSFDSFHSHLDKKLKKKKFHILIWEKNIREKTYRFELGFRNKKIYTLILKPIKKEISRPIPPFKKAKVAIVIDDFGYQIKNLELWLNFKRPLTISILPNLLYSTQIANLAHNIGKEVILHLPLEPKNDESEPQEPFTITTSMSPREIWKLLDKALKSIPYLKGVSNHQGSKATEDKQVMGIIFQELKKRNLYFLDSLVTNKSVCQEIAQQIELRFAKRDIFLDNIDDVEHIKRQLNKLAEIAHAYGFAIGIGHVRSKTLQALEETYPVLEEKGIEFVFLSELVK
ncbi:MAG: divergent polysaccharide deacetylase family protein [Candidatus Omnitrophica bacterium]|nr:divergent polysaccharide deacetylase family protein [Candidatus Omnitrophota bacterium]MCM8793689.1 divergent polysaccharide deacetylase family protein [Candidatus Omnitrophota bacterium]